MSTLSYYNIEEFLADLRKKFGREDKEAVKVAKLKRLEQGGKTMEEFVQEFRKIAREYRYEEQSLVEEFKYSINSTIQ